MANWDHRYNASTAGRERLTRYRHTENGAMRTAWNNLKSQAKRRGIRFRLSFEDFQDVWAAHWHERHLYNLRRYGDAGAFYIDNITVCLRGSTPTAPLPDDEDWRHVNEVNDD